MDMLNFFFFLIPEDLEPKSGEKDMQIFFFL